VPVLVADRELQGLLSGCKMKLVFIILFTFFFRLENNAQKKYFFEDIELDSTYTLVGWASIFDKTKAYSKFNFYIKDLNVLDSIKKKLFYFEKGVENYMQRNHFYIGLYKNKEFIDIMAVNPEYNNIWHMEKPYYFNFDSLKLFTKNFHFDYTFQDVVVKDMEEGQRMYIDSIGLPDVISINPPRFSYEGSFLLRFKRDRYFDTPKSMKTYLARKLKKILGNDDFIIDYAESHFYADKSNEVTLTVYSNKILYDHYLDGNCLKLDWEPLVYKVSFFRKRN
jgi:hypothetical protein